VNGSGRAAPDKVTGLVHKNLPSSNPGPTRHHTTRPGGVLAPFTIGLRIPDDMSRSKAYACILTRYGQK
jgi:hypothetical protein